jgi:hypothetical protein
MKVNVKMPIKSIDQRLILWLKPNSTFFEADGSKDEKNGEKRGKNMIVTGLEPATSRPVILRSTIDLHDRTVKLWIDSLKSYFSNLSFYQPKNLNFTSLLFHLSNISITTI